MGNSSSSSGSGGNTNGDLVGGVDVGDRSNSDRRPSRPGLASRGLSHRITGGGSNNNAGGRGLLSIPSSLPSPFRSGGSLGLSRSELEERCKPSGLYPTCEWEPKQIRRLIGNGQLAARLRGTDSRLAKTDRECPICFMWYAQTNVSKCCNATLCTECYLQIKPGKDRYCICPFCNNPKMVINVAKGMDEGDVARREEEEQRVIEATIRNRANHGEGLAPGTVVDGSSGSERPAPEVTFGSSLASYNRARTFSGASSASATSGSSGAVDGGNPANSAILPSASDSADLESSALMSLAMTPDDRRALESEMRAQLSHETHRRMESEAEEARMRHAQEWYGGRGSARARMREARLAELTGLLERMSGRDGVGRGPIEGTGANADSAEGQGGGGPLMARETSQGGVGLGRPGGLGGLLRAMESSSGGVRGGERGGGGLEDLMRLEAAFFLGMDGGAGGLGRISQNSINSGNHELSGAERTGQPPLSDLGRTGGRRAIRRLVPGRGVSSTHLDTAELLMRGVSEEEQLAMAIAMSMQDVHQQEEESTPHQEEGGWIAEERAMRSNNEGRNDDLSLSSDSTEDIVDVGGVNNTVVARENGCDDNNQVNNATSNMASLDSNEEEVVFADV